MKNILTIFKKEWDRVIKDRRLVLTVMILPGLMIFLIYTFIGSAMTNMYTPDTYNIAIVNPQVEFTAIYEEYEDTDLLNVISITRDQTDTYKTLIDDGEWELFIDFSDNIATYNDVGDKPSVAIYSNQNEIISSQIKGRFVSYLSIFQNNLSFELYGDKTYFNLNQDGTEIENNGISGTILASLLPMLIIMFLFSGAMSIGPESIAGEKERGTIATLLVTPVKRSEIAAGKIFALSVLTLISANSSFVGIILSLPKMLDVDSCLSGSIYSFTDYLMILAVLFSTVFVIVGIISIISAYAKSLKEAGSMIMPIYILTVLISITSMFSDGANPNLIMYIIPVYNAVQTLNAIFTFNDVVLPYLLITIISNIVYLTLFVYILNRMFNSEKIMFSK